MNNAQSQIARTAAPTTGSTLKGKLDDIFRYHAPDRDQQVQYEALRAQAKEFALMICEVTPPCADQTAAIRLVREAVMTANAAIALKGLV